jgi:hypothetical protein
MRDKTASGLCMMPRSPMSQTLRVHLPGSPASARHTTPYLIAASNPVETLRHIYEAVKNASQIVVICGQFRIFCLPLSQLT